MANEFDEYLKEMGMIFTPPEGYETIRPKQNRDVRYVHALRNAENNFEIRYLLRPIREQVPEYQRWRQEGEGDAKILVDPNKIFMPFFQSILINVAGDGSVAAVETIEDSEDINTGADEMMMAVMFPSSEFGQNFRRCTIIAMLKTDIGMAFIFHLSADVVPRALDFKVMMQSLRFSKI
jgi:hypothetical protein